MNSNGLISRIFTHESPDGVSYDEIFLTVNPLPSENTSQVTERLLAFVDEAACTITAAEAFIPANDAHSGCLYDSFTERRAPLSRIINENPAACSASVHLRAIRGIEVRPVFVEDTVAGVVYTAGKNRYCELSGIAPPSTVLPEAGQARQVFQRLEQALAAAGMKYRDIVRTWFYNKDILRWYNEFNRVRTGFYQDLGINTQSLPASTGIGAANAFGSALVCSAVAVSGQDFQRLTVESDLQCPAHAYGSSFSRALLLCTPGGRKLFVSGTASINKAGETAHVDDMEGQVILTLRAVGHLLKNTGMDWADVFAGIAYIRPGQDRSVFERLYSKLPVKPPLVVTHNVICRNDLLFELEVTALARA